MKKVLSLCLAGMLAVSLGGGWAMAAGYPNTGDMSPTVAGDKVLLAHHFGNRPDELFDPVNVHGGDYSDSIDPNPDMPVEPENRPYIDPGTDVPEPPGNGNMGPPDIIPGNGSMGSPDTTTVTKGKG